MSTLEQQLQHAHQLEASRVLAGLLELVLSIDIEIPAGRWEVAEVGCALTMTALDDDPAARELTLRRWAAALGAAVQTDVDDVLSAVAHRGHRQAVEIRMSADLRQCSAE